MRPRWLLFLSLVSLRAAAADVDAPDLPALLPDSAVSVYYAHAAVPGADQLFGGDLGGNGYGVAGTYALDKRFYLVGRYDAWGIDFFGLDLEWEDWRVGGGARLPLSEDWQLTGELTWERVEFKFRALGDEADGEGFGARLGVRGRLFARVELDAGLRYVNYDISGPAYLAPAPDELRRELGLVIRLARHLGLTLGNERGASYTTERIGVRFGF